MKNTSRARSPIEPRNIPNAVQETTPAVTTSASGPSDETGGSKSRSNQLIANPKADTRIPFAMYVKLAVDRATNTMVINVDHLKIFGGLPATKILKWGPMHLDKLISMPPNESMMVKGNTIMVKPFGLFPPPRIDGQLADVKVGKDDITISFAGAPVAAPHSDAKNYVYMSGGICQFGKFRMEDTDVLIVDQNQSNPFRFSVAHYADMIKKSRIDVRELRSITVSMPDS